MNEPSERAIQALPELDALVDDVLGLSGRIGSMHSISIGDPASASGDRAGYMALLYVSKQHEHLESVRVLVGAGQHRDAWLITRTMMEGVAQLLWAHRNQPQGPDEWYWYGIIEDWRQLVKNRVDTSATDATLESVAQDYLVQYGERYYSDKARKKAEAGKPLPTDPYRHQWNQLSARSMFEEFEEAKGVEIYDGFYRAASGWLHWSPRQMHLAIDDEGDVLRHQMHDPSRAAQALAAGVASLLQSLEILNHHFGLELAGELDRIACRLDLVMKATIQSYQRSIDS